jgi:hypothetical protein
MFANSEMQAGSARGWFRSADKLDEVELEETAMSTRHVLSPAEAVFLLAPRSETAVKCLEAGLLGLLGTGRIYVEEAERSKEPSLWLEEIPSAADPALPQHLAALEEVLVKYNGRTCLAKNEVLHALQKGFGYGYGKYLHDEVAPGLVERQLLERTDSRLLGLIPRTRYKRTALGEALAAPMERLMGDLERFPALVRSDPDAALKLARSAGVLLLMSPKARRQIPAVRRLLDERGEDHAAPIYFSEGLMNEGAADNVAELGDLSLALDMGSLLDGLEAVGDLTSDGDGGASDGGDGGGGGD